MLSDLARLSLECYGQMFLVPSLQPATCLHAARSEEGCNLTATLRRSLLTQEGICLTLEPGFRFLEVAYPYVARRLLTDEDPALRERLFEVRAAVCNSRYQSPPLLTGAHDTSLRGSVLTCPAKVRLCKTRVSVLVLA